MRITAAFLVALACCGAGVPAYCQASETPAFEVASIRAAAPPEPGRGMRMGSTGGPGTRDPGRFTAENMSLSNLIMNAYDVRPYQMTGGPSWLNSERFDITAKVPLGATKEQFRLMLQNLLAERFKLVLHHEQKEMPIYELVVAKDGHKLKEAAEQPPADDGAPRTTVGSGPPGPPKFDKDGYPIMTGSGMMMMNGRARMQTPSGTMPELAIRLSGQLGKPVIDATGLKGKYDYSLYWSMEGMAMGGGPGMMRAGGGGMGAPPPPPSPGAGAAGPGAGMPLPEGETGPTLIGAIQQQLGLKLDSKKGPVDILVIDKIEKTPVEN